MQGKNTQTKTGHKLRTMQALEAWAAAHGKPAYDCLAYSYWTGTTEAITRRNGGVKKLFLLLGHGVTVERGRRFLCVHRRDTQNPFTITDIIADTHPCEKGRGTVIWCREWCDAGAAPAAETSWVPTMLLQPDRKLVTHFGSRRWEVEDAVMADVDTDTDTDGYDWEIAETVPDWITSSGSPGDAVPASLMFPDSLPDAGADAKTTVAAMTRGAVDPVSVQFAALAWLVATKQAVPARAIASQIIRTDKPEHIVIWVREAGGGGGAGAKDSATFTVARTDGSAFVRVFASIVGDFAHGGVVAQWHACMDNVAAAGAGGAGTFADAVHARHMLTIYSNRHCDETQGVWCKDALKMLTDATDAAVSWAFDHHPRGEEFAVFNTEEDSPPGSSDDSNDSDDDL